MGDRLTVSDPDNAGSDAFSKRYAKAVVRNFDGKPGIPTEMVGRLFTPFASSKATGTGLGLSISRRIVEEHGGTLTAANRPEGGASFTILLPANPIATPVAAMAATGDM